MSFSANSTNIRNDNGKGKMVLITGASRGIGQAIAKSFAATGYDLTLTCVSSISSLKDFAESLSSTYGIKVQAFSCDGREYEQVAQLFSQLSNLDILINNAGISHMGLLQYMTVSQWKNVMAANLDSVFYMCKHAIPLMLHKKEGRIINISSIWGNVGASMESAYSASKGGVNAFTKALARELAPSNIQVNAIACGMIDTDMNSHFSKEDLDYITEDIPMGRMGQTIDVAELVLQTALAPSYMTGQIITIDGGFT
ncbi:SDR family oxidoreductase [Lachnospiraceae bacterium OttesenSCG-928-D06]|nr:SDR family oxidoreductase [Lachnospiraceae bacterium OttesenSCG-928-D06]